MKKSLKGGFLAAFLAFSAFCVLGICGAFVNLNASENAVNSSENAKLPSLRGSGEATTKQSTSLNLNENSNFVMLSDSETSLLNLNENSTEIQPTPPSLRGDLSPKRLERSGFAEQNELRVRQHEAKSTSLNSAENSTLLALNSNENFNPNSNTTNSHEISAENSTEIPNQSEIQNENLQESNLQSPFILINSNILKPEAVGRLTQIGQELYNKTGVFAGLAVSTKFSLDELKSLLDAINPPYAVILMSIKDKKIFIAQNGTQTFVNGEKVLENSVYRLLNQKNDPYGAALVNGYADLTDSLAAYFDLTLESSFCFGNSLFGAGGICPTKMTMNVLRIGIYGFICIALLYYFTRRTKRKKV